MFKFLYSDVQLIQINLLKKYLFFNICCSCFPFQLHDAVEVIPLQVSSAHAHQGSASSSIRRRRSDSSAQNLLHDDPPITSISEHQVYVVDTVLILICSGYILISCLGYSFLPAAEGRNSF